MEPIIKEHILQISNEIQSLSWIEKIEYLYQNQFETWRMARNHYRQFESVQRRFISFEGFRIDLQFNSARARSTCADLSKPAIENRRCFLCAAHLPVEQKGFVVLDRYLLLVNPFPIFGRHLTISDFKHTPQNISGRINDMLQICRQLEGYTVFYNGPRCGASAPDHFHFQAVKAGEMPVDSEVRLLKETQGILLVNEEDIQVISIEKYLRSVVIFESAYAEPIDYFFDQFIEQLPADEEFDEPMMNLLANYTNGQYRLTLFPRQAQRPSCYFREGDDRILVSPASVELGGVVVTPSEDNFNLMTKDDLIEIFDEVSLNVASIKNISL